MKYKFLKFLIYKKFFNFIYLKSKYKLMFNK